MPCNETLYHIQTKSEVVEVLETVAVLPGLVAVSFRVVHNDDRELNMKLKRKKRT